VHAKLYHRRHRAPPPPPAERERGRNEEDVRLAAGIVVVGIPDVHARELEAVGQVPFPAPQVSEHVGPALPPAQVGRGSAGFRS